VHLDRWPTKEAYGITCAGLYGHLLLFIIIYYYMRQPNTAAFPPYFDILISPLPIPICGHITYTSLGNPQQRLIVIESRQPENPPPLDQLQCQLRIIRPDIPINEQVQYGRRNLRRHAIDGDVHLANQLLDDVVGLHHVVAFDVQYGDVVTGDVVGGHAVEVGL
jgi:hypothetical protein